MVALEVALERPEEVNSTLFGLINSCQFFWIIIWSFQCPATIQSWRAIWKCRARARRRLRGG
jgi:hypothetical protein